MDQVVITVDEKAMENERRKEAVELERIGSRKLDDFFFFLGHLGFTRARLGPDTSKKFWA